MGCIFSKPGKVFSKVHRTSSYTTPDKNGIARVKKIHINQVKRGSSASKHLNPDGPVTNGTSGHGMANDRLRLQPPPPPPSASPSPPSSPLTPRETSVYQLQDAADLVPALAPCSGSPIPSELTVSDMTDSQTVATASRVKVGALWKTSSSLHHELLSVEDLEAGMEDSHKLSGPQYRFSTDGRINPGTTDVLLPRRKEKHQTRDRSPVDNAATQATTASHDVRDTTSRAETPVTQIAHTGHDVIAATTRVETPVTQIAHTGHDTIAATTRMETPVTQMSLIDNDTTSVTPRAENKTTFMTLKCNDVTDSRPRVDRHIVYEKPTEHYVKSDLAFRKTVSSENGGNFTNHPFKTSDTENTQYTVIEDIVSDSCNLRGETNQIIAQNSHSKPIALDKHKQGKIHIHGELSKSIISDPELLPGDSQGKPQAINIFKNSEERGEKEKEMSSDSITVPTHMSLYEQNLQQSKRVYRKRKRSGNRRKDRPTRNSCSEGNFDGFLKGNLGSGLRSRPESVTSTWTLDSKESFGSTSTLHSCDMIEGLNERPDMTSENHTQPYSYLTSATTPVSFTSLNMETPTDVIDLEEHDEDDDNCHGTDKREEKFDAWLGMKPYTVYPSGSPLDSSSRYDHDAPESGPSTSAIHTKQKLLYAKFARRPRSETMLAIAGRPPLPPGKDTRRRPMSDTGSRAQPFSRYFASNVEMNF